MNAFNQYLAGLLSHSPGLGVAVMMNNYLHDVATALLDWAQRNAVSDLVLGAGTAGSDGVAVRVARQAACNVQLVRAAPGERLTG